MTHSPYSNKVAEIAARYEEHNAPIRQRFSRNAIEYTYQFIDFLYTNAQAVNEISFRREIKDELANLGFLLKGYDHIDELVLNDDFDNICNKFKDDAREGQLTETQIANMRGYMKKYMELAPHATMEDMGYSELDKILRGLHTSLLSKCE